MDIAAVFVMTANHVDEKNVRCNGAYINKQFIIAAKLCIEKFSRTDKNIKIFNHDQCQNGSVSGKLVRKIHKFGDLALLEMSKRDTSLRNYPLCLPEPKTWFVNQPTMKYLQFGRVFSMTSSSTSSCKVKDSFVKVDINGTSDGCQLLSNKKMNEKSKETKVTSISL